MEARVLRPEETAEIEEELAALPARRAACIAALAAVNRHRGWVSDEAVEEIAAFLDMSPHEVDSVATFYNLIHRRPVGRHVVRVCDSVSCWIVGAQGVWDAFRARGLEPGATSPDGRLTLLPIQCLGACERAPALMVDEDLHTSVDPDRLDDVLGGYE